MAIERIYALIHGAMNISVGLKYMLITSNLSTEAARGTVVVKALCYKPEGRRFDAR
jgi:hypothetical protein